MSGSAGPDDTAAASQDAAGAPRVDFYILAGTEARARLKLACRLAEKAYAARQRVLVWLEDPAELASFDELLWTFADRSFVPHEPFADAQQWQQTAVLLSCQGAQSGQFSADQTAERFDVLLNLASTIPAVAAHARRIIEVIDSEPARRQDGRQRFRQYRDRGVNPQTHHIAADEAG